MSVSYLRVGLRRDNFFMANCLKMGHAIFKCLVPKKHQKKNQGFILCTMSLIAGFYMDVKGYDKQTSITGSRVQTIKKHKNASFKS